MAAKALEPNHTVVAAVDLRDRTERGALAGRGRLAGLAHLLNSDDGLSGTPACPALAVGI
jgi:hypothetical protein